MSYCTTTDLIERFGETELRELTDDENLGQIDDAAVARAIADADAIIDAHIGTRYSLPLSTVPALLTGLSCDLVRVQLYDDIENAAVTNAGNRARALLRDIRDGKLELPGSNDASAAAIGEPVFAESGRQFTNRNRRGF